MRRLKGWLLSLLIVVVGPATALAFHGSGVLNAGGGGGGGGCGAGAGVTVSTAVALTEAVSTAANGEHICVATGAYPEMTWNGGGSRTVNAVVEPAPAAVVTFAKLREQASNLEVRNINMPGTSWEIVGATKQVRMVEDTATHFEITSEGVSAPEFISIIGGSYGPNHHYPDNRIGSSSSKLASKHILIEGVEIHDQTRSSTEEHFECLQIWAAEDIKIRNNTIRKCSIFSIFLQHVDPSACGSGCPPTPKNVTIENNQLDCCTEDIGGKESTPPFSFVMNFASNHQEMKWAGVTIRNNTMDAPFILNTNNEMTFSGVNIENNIAPKVYEDEGSEHQLSVSTVGVHTDYNLWYEGSAIGPHDKGTTSTSSIFAAFPTDLHLKATSPAIDAGDPLFSSSEDLEGNPRSLSVAPDQGAFEYVSGFQRFISPSGKDTNPCTEAQPCKTFQKGYEAAGCGDVVEVESGRYASGEWTEPGGVKDHGELIPYSAAKAACTADVAFRPAKGATVELGPSLRVLSGHVVVQNMALGSGATGKGDAEVYDYDPAGIYGGHAVQWVSLQGLTGRNFELSAVQHVNVLGGSYGPASACGTGKPGKVQYGGANNALRSQPEDKATPQVESVVIAGLTVHEIMSYNELECHTEGLAIFSGKGVTVANSKFYGNDVFDVFDQNNSGGEVGSVNLLNNWFAVPTKEAGEGASESGAVVLDVPQNFTVANNSFLGEFKLEGASTGFTGKYVGNIGLAPAYFTPPSGPAGNLCGISSVTGKDNLSKSTAFSCASTPNRNSEISFFPYVSAVSTSSLDYHLEGVGGSAKAFVPIADQLVQTDLDGETRPGTAGDPSIDAGSDEVP